MATENYYGSAVIQRVAYSRLFSSSWQTIFDTLNDNLSDPSARSEKWIYGSFPDKADDDINYYPLIVIGKTSFQNISAETIDRNLQKYQMNCDVEVFTTDAAQLDSISDSVIEVLQLNQTTLPWNFTFNTSTDEFYTRSGKRIHVRKITTNFEYVLSL